MHTSTSMMGVVLLLQALVLGCGSPSGGDVNKAAGPTAVAPAAGGAKDQVVLARAAAALKELGIAAETLRLDNGTLTLSYEASTADKYDHQVVVEWASIFGVLGFFAERTVTIVNTAGGKPMVSLTAAVKDIEAFVGKRSSFGEFVRKIRIKNLAG